MKGGPAAVNPSHADRELHRQEDEFARKGHEDILKTKPPNDEDLVKKTATTKQKWKFLDVKDALAEIFLRAFSL